MNGRLKDMNSNGRTSVVMGISLSIMLWLCSGCLSLTLYPSADWEGMPLEPRLVEQAIDEAFTESRLTGLSIAVVKDGNILWAKGYGQSNLKKKTPITVDTPFRAGRLSSLVTVAALREWMEREDIPSGTPVTKLLQGAKIHTPSNEEPTVTLAHLLAHRAGLPTVLAKESEFEKYDPTKDFDTVPRELSLLWNPDTVSFYSHLGMVHAAQILVERSGQSFDDFVQQTLFSPLGMTHSTFLPLSNTKKIPKYYHRFDIEEPLEIGFPRDRPSIGMTTTALDYARFLAYAMKPGPQGQPSVIDLAQICRHWEADPRCAMLASDAIGSGAIALVPEHQLAAVVFSNTAVVDAVLLRLAWDALNQEAQKGGFALPTAMACGESEIVLPEKAYDGLMAAPFGVVLAKTKENRILMQPDASRQLWNMINLLNMFSCEDEELEIGTISYRFQSCGGTTRFTAGAFSAIFSKERTSQMNVVVNSSTKPAFWEGSVAGAAGLFALSIPSSNANEVWLSRKGLYRKEEDEDKQKEADINQVKTGGEVSTDNPNEMSGKRDKEDNAPTKFYLVPTENGLLTMSFGESEEEASSLAFSIGTLFPLSDNEAAMTLPSFYLGGSGWLQLVRVSVEDSDPDAMLLNISGEVFRRQEEK